MKSLFNIFKSAEPKVEPKVESRDIKENIQRKSHVYSLQPGSFMEYVFGGRGYVSAAQAMGFYRESSAVATAVDMIADAIEQIKPVVQTADGKFVDTHPVLDILSKPNGFNHWRDFIGAVARNYLLKHDSLMTLAGNVNSPPLEIWPVSLQNVSIVQDMDDYPRSYIATRGVLPGSYERETTGRNDIRFYDGPLKEIYHIRGYSSRFDQTESDSPLQAAALEARQLIQGKYHNLQLLNNGGRLSLLIFFNDNDEVNIDEHNERIQRINEQYGGANNAGKIGVMSNADVSNVTEFGVNNKDMDYVNMTNMASAAVYLRYRIPLPLVTNDASTFNNMITAIELFYDDAVLPNADTIFSGLSFLLMPRYKKDPLKERITYNPESINALKQRMLSEVEKRKRIAVETTNELRSLLPGREPLTDEGGNTLYQPANLVPIGTDLFTDDNNRT